ncbi:glycoprotease family-domain-containing protein [Lipomyces arxii]|uniref:glycoprotease family-domain-containing protein n=1 Tax=Lipomyces arxii TaxID=56418 RepID=UPI0034CD1092
MFSTTRTTLHRPPPRIRSLVRTLRVLAIETSCDDTAVCVLDHTASSPPELVFDARMTLNSAQTGGIVPVQAIAHHMTSLAPLVASALATHPSPPDLVCATRGPGMRGCLTIGLEHAKALAVAFNVPLVGVNHMLGHLLVPRMLALDSPRFPFVSLLVSGGHTLLVHSSSALTHVILAETVDIAIGDALDKCARVLGFCGVHHAAQLDAFVKNVNNTRPVKPDEIARDGIRMSLPMKTKPNRPQSAAFSFASFETMVKYGIADRTLSEREREVVATQVQRTVFEHLIDRTRYALSLFHPRPTRFVLSGGVASNSTLRAMLEAAFADVEFYFVPPALCIDNARMIAWAGIEMYEAGLQTALSATPIGKWPLDNMVDHADSWILRKNVI